MGHGRYIDPFAGVSSRGELFEVRGGETLELEYVVLPGESRDMVINVDLTGPGASVNIKGLYLLGGDETVSIRTVVHHRAPGCHSTQLFKGVAGGRSRFSFDGVIVVAPGADGTEAFQENHNIVLSQEAKVETQPQLEIYTDDVKCSHGATTGRLGEEELFYMRSRGIPEAQAKTLQILSFISGVVPAGREEEIAEAVRKL